MSLRAEVDHGLCIGYAECARIASEAFRLNDANQSEPITGASGVSDEILMAAAMECPANAIRVVSSEGEIVCLCAAPCKTSPDNS
jgi:ferredoxin